MQLYQVDSPYNHISHSFNTAELEGTSFKPIIVQHGT